MGSFCFLWWWYVLVVRPLIGWVLVAKDGTITFLGNVEIDTSLTSAGLKFRFNGAQLWSVVTSNADTFTYERGELNFIAPDSGETRPVMSLLRTSRGRVAPRANRGGN